MESLTWLRDVTWLYVAAPLLAAAGLWVTVRLVAPQVTRLGDGFRALRAEDPDAEGDVTPATATWLAAAASYGAAAAVGAATAVALGGAGALPWVWLFAFLIAPLRYVEALLARTTPPGRAEGIDARGTLAGRLLAGGKLGRALGATIAVLLVGTAFAFGGALHGAAAEDAAVQLLPASVPAVVWGAAAVAGILAVAGPARSGSVAGWLALAALGILVLVGIWAAASEPSRAMGAIARAFGEALDGAPAATPFVGAFAGEIAVAALLHAVPPLAATTGASGALHGLARARTTRGQAAAALLGPLAYALVTTVLVVAFVATGAFYRRTETVRPLSELTVYRIDFESASQRDEPERRYTGVVRLVDGEPRGTPPIVGTERGTVKSPRWLYRGAPADVAIAVENGVVKRLQVPEDGVLRNAPPSELSQISVSGEMLARGGGLVAVALSRGTGGDLGPRLALAALLVLAAVGAAAWGFAARRSLPGAAPGWAGPLIAVLPPVGLALAATGLAPWLLSVGGWLAGVLVALVAVILVAHLGEARRLLGK